MSYLKFFAALNLVLILGALGGCEDVDDVNDVDLRDDDFQMDALYIPGAGDLEASCDNGPTLWNSMWESVFPGSAYSIDTLVGSLAGALNGLNARGSCMDDYRSIILDTTPGTGHQANVKDGLEAASGCGLTVMGIWRAIGITDPELWGKYKNGTVGQVLETIARRYWAYHDTSDAVYSVPTGDELFAVGNTVGVLFDYNGVKNVHYFVVSTAPIFNPYTNTWHFYGINGGGKTYDGHQLITTVPMNARLQGNNWYVRKGSWTSPHSNFWPEERKVKLFVKTNLIPRKGHVHSLLPLDLEFLRLNLRFQD